VASYHEPDPEDPALMNLRYAGFHTVADAMMTDRFKRMKTRSEGKRLHVECNSYLRYEADWLKSNLNAKLVHLVRDGRTYIQSAYVRDVYTPWDKQMPIVPHNDDPMAARWPSLSRFEKLCWYWNHSNTVLMESIPTCVQMEALFKDYTVFSAKLLKPLDIHISEQAWRKAVERPRNTKNRYLFRKQLKRWLFPGTTGPDRTPLGVWTADHQRDFENICGRTMKRLGYSI
jgi:hypothetical protein